MSPGKPRGTRTTDLPVLRTSKAFVGAIAAINMPVLADLFLSRTWICSEGGRTIRIRFWICPIWETRPWDSNFQMLTANRNREPLLPLSAFAIIDRQAQVLPVSLPVGRERQS
jgi:hypothetical protein